MPSMTNTQQIETGVYTVTAKCPRCGATEQILAGIRAVLTTPENDIGSLKVQLKAKAMDHECEQTRIEVDRETGEVLP